MENLKTFEIKEDELSRFNYALITTSKGKILIKLFPQDAPQTVTNFATLAENGFYDGLNFHRVIAGFVAQGGCPIGNGTGGPGYRIKCELQDNPHKHQKGTLSMAHAGRDTGGSQFFICFAEQPHLNGEHTVFGRIQPNKRESLKTLDSLKQGDKILSIRIYEDEESIQAD
ncbi:MAG: peptidylprolyl isomerase [Helicobacter sp.]|uniref:peptidylprolyl isomerase n=1 Tax=Helicobacter sp. 10-6591 TaxID=2004998 RepID=UPI000DCCA9CD|nr:peptidylprolyl isomerase [Helicobacter sp. 10-6591]MCI6217915.1 peptidylprolyl isomerase [Helicobacter sp.]MCI7485114.1 peptidylprolyl isomerase [Helicobacter sp.]MDD7568180.1 peptidylprolyl isomerase [Helicobacter sp.]MDY5740847.1 peptidylprolyl isomerase [Helicobacter sp.]RAX55048.1 peptidylprolyl isomerase [Helicobacter sp. 10-6591]